MGERLDKMVKEIADLGWHGFQAIEQPGAGDPVPATGVGTLVRS